MLKRILPENSPVQLHHLLFFAFLVVFLPKTGFYFDMLDRPAWITHMKIHGLTNAYGSGSNYLPLGLYILYFFGLFFPNPDTIKDHFYLFKIVVLAFDFAAAIGLTYAFRHFVSRKYLEYLLLLNVAFLYNTLFWGQQDGIHCALMVFSVIFLLQDKPILGVVFAVLAINAKLQSIIILPVLGIVLVYYLVKNIKLLPKIILWAVAVQVIILLPFLLTHKLNEVLSVMKNSVGFFPRVSWGAYNLWYLVLQTDPAQVNDFEIFHRLSYKVWGFLLFFVLSGLALLPLIYNTFQLIRTKQLLDKNYFSLIFLTLGLLSIIFFFVNTQMHERYAHPALLFFFGYGLLSGRYLLYGLTSVAYLFNIDGVYQYFHLYLKLPIVKPEIVALIFVSILILSFADFFKYLKLNKLFF
jgi:Gpi18-like mannosyltransferase